MSTPVNSHLPSNHHVNSNTKLPTNHTLTTVFRNVYYIECQQGAGFYGPIGIRPTITKNSIKWEDTGKGQPSIPVNLEAIEVDGHPSKGFLGNPEYIPNEIVITKKNGTKVTFRLLDIKLYNTVKYKLGNAPDFKNTEELRDFYLDHDFLT